MENAVSDLRSKAKTHVTGKRAALEEIGNRVATRATHISKVKEHLESLYRKNLDCCSILIIVFVTENRMPQSIHKACERT